MKTAILFALAVLSVGCASQGVEEREPLPFHVAVVPVEAEKVELIEIDEDDRAKVKLEIDGARLSEVLLAALDGKTFAQASLMQVPDEGRAADAGDEFWLQQARALGADLILDTDLEYDEDVGTEINDRFWLNLPLFLLGGPATWFVNDRSYQFQAQIKANVYDVSAATRLGDVLDSDSHVMVLNREVKEVSLDFLDRADGAGSYALSILVPSGFLAKNSDNVSEELELLIGDQLSSSLSESLQDRKPEMIESERLVDFFPRDFALRQEGDECYLAATFKLERGPLGELPIPRIKVDGGPWIEAEWSAGSDGNYELLWPVGGSAPGSVQVEVQQVDSEVRARTFTYKPLASSTPR